MRVPRLLIVLPLVVLGACSTSDTQEAESITVFAASSLADVFTDVADLFESENPGTTVQLNFASSSDLAMQIIEGAPVDVFASADEANVDKVRASGIPTGTSRAFAGNSLQIMVESGNPKNIRTLADLSDPELIYVTCDESVPIGRYSADVLARAGVRAMPKSYEESAKGIVNKIRLGEADVGIVYRSDVIAAGSSAEGIDIPDDLNVDVEYPITALGVEPSARAQAFIDFLLTSQTARSLLIEYGFTLP